MDELGVFPLTPSAAPTLKLVVGWPTISEVPPSGANGGNGPHLAGAIDIAFIRMRE
jgi:hypothetical protein